MDKLMNPTAQAPQAAAPAINLDVYAENPGGLRRRLQDRPAQLAASLLPGGMIMEETDEALTYRVGTFGPWTIEQRDGEIRLSNDMGHTLTVRDGQVIHTIAK
jgi:hypothetical protein